MRYYLEPSRLHGRPAKDGNVVTHGSCDSLLTRVKRPVDDGIWRPAAIRTGL
jgi:hypothetical protein